MIFLSLAVLRHINVSSMNSGRSRLCINSSHNIDTRLLWEAAVCGDCTQEIDDKIIKAPVL